MPSGIKSDLAELFVLSREGKQNSSDNLSARTAIGNVACALEPRTESRMSVMDERRTARRYDLTLPISIRFAAERLVNRQEGKTRDISTRGLYFVIGQDLEAGSELDIMLTLPAEITHGTDVFVRAQGKVVRVERRVEDGEPRMGVAAVIERYDIIRGEPARA
jgi:PilZ domain